MNRHHLIKLIVAWTIAWLPMAGVLASTMPIAALATATASLVTLDQSTPLAASADFDSSNTPCHTAEESNADHDGKPCSHCVLCHLAGAIVPPTVPTMPRNTLHELPESIDSVAFTSFIAELPQRPPSLPRA